MAEYRPFCVKIKKLATTVEPEDYGHLGTSKKSSGCPDFPGHFI